MRKARANGGYLIHLLPHVDGFGPALCGHLPKNTARMMENRGKWLILADQSIAVTCRRCKERAGG